MTDDQMQPIHPGCVRIMVRLGEVLAAGDFLADVLPEWLHQLELAVAPL
jgi:hypothetical protein